MNSTTKLLVIGYMHSGKPCICYAPDINRPLYDNDIVTDGANVYRIAAGQLYNLAPYYEEMMERETPSNCKQWRKFSQPKHVVAIGNNDGVTDYDKERIS